MDFHDEEIDDVIHPLDDITATADLNMGQSKHTQSNGSFFSSANFFFNVGNRGNRDGKSSTGSKDMAGLGVRQESLQSLNQT